VSVSLLQADPSAALSVPRSPRRLPRPMPEGDLHTAIVNAPPRIRPWLMLAALGGLRCCEIARLRREDVLNSHTPPALLVHGKGDKERVVPLPAQLLHELTPLPRAGWLFARLDGRSGPVNAADRERAVQPLPALHGHHAQHALDPPSRRDRVVRGEPRPAAGAGVAGPREPRDHRGLRNQHGRVPGGLLGAKTSPADALVPGEAADVVGRVAARPFGLAARRLA